MDDVFPIIKIQGDAAERGRTHGTQLKERIQRTIQFYRKQFQIPEQQILEISDGFRTATAAFRQDIYTEIETLAQAAEVDPLWIYALNGRTELLNLNPMECTTLAFKNQRILGQNWDWESDIEELAVILDIETEDGHRILTMTEPGMIGKIGMNNHGVGVGLNFMTIRQLPALRRSPPRAAALHSGQQKPGRGPDPDRTPASGKSRQHHHHERQRRNGGPGDRR